MLCQAREINSHVQQLQLATWQVGAKALVGSCAFCQTEVESVEHLLFSCRVSSSFWKHVLSRLRDYNISVENLKEEDVIFGKFDIAEDFHALINSPV